MADAATPESIPYTHEFTVDASYQRVLTRALYLSLFRSASGWILLGVIAVLAGAGILGGVSSVFLVSLLVVVLAWVLRYFRVRTLVRRSFPVGKMMRSGFTATHFGISDRDDASVVAYSGFDSIKSGSGVVWLRRRSPRRLLVYPAALFPEDQISVIRAAIAGSGVAPA